ncbi:MAG: protein-L-isoaspartate(D-aspartate) O-methyltransferase [Aestuariivita sp.]|nr:protein-L-isoaspartate(D-aspartate) O-methyltransferase [Aestuariivita sp.]
MSGHLSETQMKFIFALRSNGVIDSQVLSAMESVDRRPFVRGHFENRSYEDIPLPINCGQTISQPSVVGLMTQALQVESRSKVLEIGTGSGYQTAILSRLARRVYSVDRHRRLVTEAQNIFHHLQIFNVTFLFSDGTLGLPNQAPFDRIIITAAAEDPPTPLLAQLKTGGVMVLPVGQSNIIQNLIRIEKQPIGLKYTEIRPVRFVPLLEGLASDSE